MKHNNINAKENEKTQNNRDNNMKLGIQMIKGGFQNRTEVEVPENIQKILSLGEKFVIPYKKYEMGDIMDMIKEHRGNMALHNNGK